MTIGDASGSGNVGTISGAVWNPAGRFGGALSFDGVDDWATVPDSNSLDVTSALTLEAWVNPSQVRDWTTVMMKEQVGNLAYGLYANSDLSLGNRPSGHVFTLNDNNLRGGSTLPVNAWTHLALTYNGSTVRLYINGAEAGAIPSTGNAVVTSAAPLHIGGNSIWGEWFSGLIDEVRIYNRALTQTEIAADMSAAVG
jgi:hypothetical protein